MALSLFAQVCIIASENQRTLDVFRPGRTMNDGRGAETTGTQAVSAG